MPNVTGLASSHSAPCLSLQSFRSHLKKVKKSTMFPVIKITWNARVWARPSKIVTSCNMLRIQYACLYFEFCVFKTFENSASLSRLPTLPFYLNFTTSLLSSASPLCLTSLPNFQWIETRHFLLRSLHQDRECGTRVWYCYTVATDEILCLKNAGTQISMFFTSNE